MGEMGNTQSDQKTKTERLPGETWEQITYLLTYLISYLLTYLLTPWNKVLLEKLIGFQPAKKFPAFYGTRRFITAFKITATCPYPEPVLSSPYPQIPLP